MNSITIENFRCFGEKQTARLAPLTLLVGENSTGKTSFLALLRALDDFVQNDVPDFKRPPYDLGSFDEIAHYRGSRGGRAEKFSVEIAALFLEDSLYRRRQKWLVTETYGQGPWRLYVQFCKDIKGTAPIPTCLRISLSDKNKEDNPGLLLTMNLRPSKSVQSEGHGIYLIVLFCRISRCTFRNVI